MNTVQSDIRDALGDYAATALPSAHGVLQGVRERQDLHRRQRRTRYAVASTALGVALVGGIIGTLGRSPESPHTVRPGHDRATHSSTTTPDRPRHCYDMSMPTPTAEPTNTPLCPTVAPTKGPSPSKDPSTEGSSPPDSGTPTS